MCLSPLTIFSPNVYKTLSFSDRIQVPCNSCPECVSVKQRGWRLRSFWQSKYEFEHDGFVYFDTLTYNSYNLPKYKDIDCFSSRHIQLFFKRLRKNLTKKGFVLGYTSVVDGVKKRVSNLQYLLTCEYGSSPTCTHRPHYHVLFFCHVPGLGIAELKNTINQCWWYGFTDQLQHTGEHYFRNQSHDSLKRIDYVTKYIGKKFEYKHEVCQKLGLDHKHLNENDELLIKDYMINGGPFMRVSQGFGAYLLDKMTPLQVLHATSTIDTPDQCGLVVGLCMYYKRKLYYDLKTMVTSDGVEHHIYMLNDTGFKMRDYTFSELVKQLATRFRSITWNMAEADKIQTMDKMAGRTFEDLAIYDICYRNKSKSVLLMNPQDAFLSRYVMTDEENGLQSSDPKTKAYYRDGYIFHLIKDKDNDSWLNYDDILNKITSYQLDEQEKKCTSEYWKSDFLYKFKNMIYR